MTFFSFVTYFRRVYRTQNCSFSHPLHGYAWIRITETNARLSAVRLSRTNIWVAGVGRWVDGCGSPGFRLGAVDKTKIPAKRPPRTCKSVSVRIRRALERISKYFLTTNSRAHPPLRSTNLPTRLLYGHAIDTYRN